MPYQPVVLPGSSPSFHEGREAAMNRAIHTDEDIAGFSRNFIKRLKWTCSFATGLPHQPGLACHAHTKAFKRGAPSLLGRYRQTEQGERRCSHRSHQAASSINLNDEHDSPLVLPGYEIIALPRRVEPQDKYRRSGMSTHACGGDAGIILDLETIKPALRSLYGKLRPDHDISLFIRRVRW